MTRSEFESPIIALVGRVQDLIRSHIYCVWFSYCPECGECILVDRCEGQGQGNLATAYVDVISGQVEVGPWTDCKQCGVLAPAVPLFDDTRVH